MVCIESHDENNPKNLIRGFLILPSDTMSNSEQIICESSQVHTKTCVLTVSVSLLATLETCSKVCLTDNDVLQNKL